MRFTRNRFVFWLAIICAIMLSQAMPRAEYMNFGPRTYEPSSSPYSYWRRPPGGFGAVGRAPGGNIRCLNGYGGKFSRCMPTTGPSVIYPPRAPGGYGTFIRPYYPRYTYPYPYTYPTTEPPVAQPAPQEPAPTAVRHAPKPQEPVPTAARHPPKPPAPSTSRLRRSSSMRRRRLRYRAFSRPRPVCGMSTPRNILLAGMMTRDRSKTSSAGSLSLPLMTPITPALARSFPHFCPRRFYARQQEAARP